MARDAAYERALEKILKAKRTGEKHLNLSYEQLSELPPEIGQLTALQTLYLFGNQLTELPESLGQLTALEELDLNGNQLAELPASLGQLTALEELHLHMNQLAELPASLGQLTALQTLYLFGNQLTELPESLGQLTALKKLHLHMNQLTVLPESFARLTALQELALDRNQLAELPETIGRCRALTKLSLENNNLARLPRSLRDLGALKVLTLHNNPQLKLPESVLGELSWDEDDEVAKPADILAYYFAAGGPLLEAKLILVGRGGVGKTSLVNRLVHQTFDPKENQTDGIKITAWDLPLNRKEGAHLNVWDFGGQEIMHSMHQFFLTERSLYLVVLNGRDGFEDEDADYWLSLVAGFGDGSPAIVVLNKVKTTPFDLDETELKKRYPFVKAFVRTDCAGKRPLGIKELHKAIRLETDGLSGIRATFPRHWFEIKDRLGEMAKRGERYLTPTEYRKICTDHGEKDETEQNRLARFLHDLGVALNFSDDERLRHAHVLSPHWLTDGIYRILTSKKVQEKHGDLKTGDLADVLPSSDYPPEMREYLCDLMRRFELGFTYPDDPNHYLIPNLLPKNTPPEAATFSDGATLDFEYTYPMMMPAGLLPRFIVRTHSLSQDQPRWRSGVIIEMGEARALVQAHLSEKRVRISVSGGDEARQSLLATIRYDFDYIHKEIGLAVEERLLPSSVDLPIPYEKLKAYEAAGRTQVDDFIDGEIVVFNVRELLNRVDPKELRHERPDRRETKKLPLLFICYAHADEARLNALHNHLKALAAARLISPWHDRRIPPGDEWDGRINERIRSADVILLVVSPAFLASRYIREKELTVAMERHDAGEAVVIPVILEKCLWKRRAVFKKLQELPRDRKPILDFKPIRDGWYVVAEGIEEVVLKLARKAKAAEV